MFSLATLFFPVAGLPAEAHQEKEDSHKSPSVRCPAILSDQSDPHNLIQCIRQQKESEKQALLQRPLLEWMYAPWDHFTKNLYDACNLDIGLSFHHAFQWLEDALPGEDRWGTATDMDFVGKWELLHRQKPNQGSLFFGIEGRWDYGTTGPQELGFLSLGSANGTANAFSAYQPTFIVRNLYWQQGGRKAGWYYRIGKITPDAILGTSKYISPNTTFLPNGGNGFFSVPLPDSGVGVMGAVELTDRVAVMALVSDANGDRFTSGELSKNQYFAAVEFAWKIAPRTKNAGYSKITWMYNPGAKAINASTGREGWGFALKLEQELTSDGRLIGIVRWGKSSNRSALYNEQVGVHLVLHETKLFPSWKEDTMGVAFNWIDASNSSRQEYDLECFYLFPVTPSVDATLHFQQVFNPAFAPEICRASVFSIRVTTTF